MPDGAAGDADQAFACRAALAAMTVPYWMALGTFAIGTEGFMIAPLLPKLVQDLSVSLVAAGQLVTVFTLSYAFSSPILTALTGGIGRRPLLILSIALGVPIITFVAVAAISLLATLGLLFGLRKDVGAGLPVASLRERIAVTGRKPVLLTLLVTDASHGAQSQHADVFLEHVRLFLDQ